MGLSKLPDGVYVLAEDLHLHRMISELVVSVVRSGPLVLVKSTPGTAQGVAAALDGAGLDGVLGSIAGDDTVLIITGGAESAATLHDTIEKLRGKH
jgi:transcriptional regulator of arginine metabolism